MMTTDEVRDTIQQALRRLTIATVVLSIIIVGLLIYVYAVTAKQTNDIKKVTVNTTSALCTFRNDLTERVTQGEQFLQKHPHGIPGIPAAVLGQSVRSAKRTAVALKGLNCPPDLPPSPTP